MTPQELEALLDLGGRYDLIGDFRRADRVRRRILGKLAPSLLGLWRAAAAWDDSPLGVAQIVKKKQPKPVEAWGIKLSDGTLAAVAYSVRRHASDECEPFTAEEVIRVHIVPAIKKRKPRRKQ